MNFIITDIIHALSQGLVKDRLMEVCHDNNIETYYTYLDENDLNIMIVPSDFKYVYDGSSIESQLENYYQKNNSKLNYKGEFIKQG